MTIEQTVEIPASRRLVIEVPQEKTASLENIIGCCANTGDSLDAYMERHWADNDMERAIELRRKTEREKDQGKSSR
ncbi:hypothetical protein ACYULU_15155 [Breznakiellaceae bacterium SP9]